MKEVRTRRFGLFKRLLSFIVALLLLISVLEPPQFLKTSFITEVQAASEEYGLPNRIEDGTIFHAFDWSFSTIKSNLSNIAEQGFGAIQTMPISNCITRVPDIWWTAYQPTNWEIGNKYGTEAEFRDLCTEAHKYGIKIIVDIVPNHMADRQYWDQISDEVKNIPNVFHNNGDIGDAWDNRYKSTQYDLLHLSDLDTQNPAVIQKTKEYISKVAACGADGFRFDMAKHIELPDDPNDYRGNFWSEITKHLRNLGIEFTYGEVLQDGGKADRFEDYAGYMRVTATNYGNNIREILNSYNIGYHNYGYSIPQSVDASKLVTWVESHDTFTAEENNTAGLNAWQRDVGWALIASRAKSVPLYLKRNNGDVDDYKSDEVKWVNRFRNAMAGYEGEYVQNYGNRVSIIERGPYHATQGITSGNAKGVVIVSGLGGNTISGCDVRLPNGIYQDRIFGNTFIVSGGKISGTLGNGNGVAVIFDYVPHIQVSADKESQTYMTDTLSVTLSAAGTISQTYKINDGSAVSYVSGQTITIGRASDQPGTVYNLNLNGTGSDSTRTKTYIYTKGDPYITVRFDKNGGNKDAVPSSKRILPSTSVGLPEIPPTRMGYAFGGWYKEAACTNVWNFDSDTVTGSMILYAKWRPTTYKVTYNLNKGKPVAGQAITYTFGVGYNLKNPMREKYKFGGWYTTPDFKGPKVKAISKSESGNKTYYAKWEQVKVNKGKIKNLSSKGKKLNITINKVDGADGYSIQYSTTNGFKKGKTKTDTLTYKGNKTQKPISKLSGKKLKVGTTYFVRVRAYKLDSAGNKVWGKYSAAKKIVLKK